MSIVVALSPRLSEAFPRRGPNNEGWVVEDESWNDKVEKDVDGMALAMIDLSEREISLA